jgi:hypothetical protein
MVAYLNRERRLPALKGAADLAARGLRMSYRTMSRVPVVGAVLRQGVAAVGEEFITGQVDLVGRDFRVFAMQMVSSVLDEVDLSPLIRDRIDVNRIVESIDMDAVLTRIDVVPVLERVEINDVVSRLDLEAVVSKLDLNAVVERLDLDAVLARIDVNALVARLDVDSIINRIDVLALVASVREQVSLSVLLRNSLRVVSDERVKRRAEVSQGRL